MSERIKLDLDPKTMKVVAMCVGVYSAGWMTVNASEFGFRRYGRSRRWFGRLERVDDLCKAASKQYNVVIKKTLKRHIRDTVAQMEADRKDVIRRCAELPAAGWRPYPFQVEDAVKMATAKMILNANPVGSGKSCEALLAAPRNAAVLLLSPKSMKGTWEQNVRRWRTDLTPVIVKTKADWRLPKPGEVVISGYEIIPVCTAEKKIALGSPLNNMLAASKLGSSLCLIADEYHVCRKYGALRTKRVRTILDYIRKHHGTAYGLTGSPLMKHPPDLWCLLQNLGLAVEVFGNRTSFVSAMGGYFHDGETRWNGKVDATARSRLAAVMVLRDKGEIWAEMPSQVHEIHDVDLSDGMLKKWLRTYEALLGSDEAQWTLQRIKDASPEDGPSYAELRRLLADAKLPAAHDLVESFEEQEEPVVVASAHRHPIEHIGARPGWACIHGGTSEKKRTQIIEQFQSWKLKGVAVVIAAGSVGIDLFRANQMIFIDQDWTEELNKQMRGRIHRRGQTRTCYYHHLTVSHPVERRVDQILRGKDAMFNNIIEATKDEVSLTETRLDRLGRLAAKISRTGPGGAYQKTLKAIRNIKPSDMPQEAWDAVQEHRELLAEAQLDGAPYDDSWVRLYLNAVIVQHLCANYAYGDLVIGRALLRSSVEEVRKRIFKV